jgi:hypothetical protein
MKTKKKVVRVGSSKRSKSPKSRRFSPKKPVNRRKTKKLSQRHSKIHSKGGRARASAPSRSARSKVNPSSTRVAKPPRRSIPTPYPTRHVAAPKPIPLAPARSMPPPVESRVISITPHVSRAEFGEAGVLLAITYSIREGRRDEFFELMGELKPLLSSIGGMDCTIYEDRSRPSYFMEVFRFRDEAEFTAFDDKFHKDRKIAAVYALLDDIVEAEKSDFKIFERRL